ncbi:MAG: alpha-ketoglutarate-dependent dioxygenase AlkB [Pseudomonadota bacterium]
MDFPYTPLGKPFSVKQVNFGELGWISDQKGYRYTPFHPETGRAWSPISHEIMNIRQYFQPDYARPECCLINHYKEAAKMGLHQDTDEEDLDTPISSISLGQAARFRIFKAQSPSPTQSFLLEHRAENRIHFSARCSKGRVQTA